jgi:hypothetical protein
MRVSETTVSDQRLTTTSGRDDLTPPLRISFLAEALLRWVRRHDQGDVEVSLAEQLYCDEEDLHDAERYLRGLLLGDRRRLGAENTRRLRLGDPVIDPPGPFEWDDDDEAGTEPPVEEESGSHAG